MARLNDWPWLRRTVRVCLAALALIAMLALIVLLIIVVQGKRLPSGNARYVAMGSSFAAGIGLGPRAPDSPFACMRTINGYPSFLAKALSLPLVDVSCSAATTEHLLHGGQYFQGAQLRAVTTATQLVTITSGGNDVGYVGDLSAFAAQQDPSLTSRLAGLALGIPVADRHRDFAKVRRDLVAVVQAIRQRAPRARVILITYPRILPPTLPCKRLNMTEMQVAAMRKVGDALAGATRAAAADSDVLLVDMDRLGAGHHACSADPWVNGWRDPQGRAFHPNLRGARATASAIRAALLHSSEGRSLSPLKVSRQ